MFYLPGILAMAMDSLHFVSKMKGGETKLSGTMNKIGQDKVNRSENSFTKNMGQVKKKL